jgi:cytochrome c biogenesis protein CcmG, thiol:disulfide interchange protein DsbE
MLHAFASRIVRLAELRLILGMIGIGLSIVSPTQGGVVTKAPDFKARDVTGEPLQLYRLLQRGPVLLDFWATWCKPCVESLPELQRWHRVYGPRGLTVVGVSVDGPRNFSKVRPFAASRGLTYSMVIDHDGTIQQLYQVLAVPTAFLIDSSGTIVRVRMAYRPGEGGAFERVIEGLLPPAKDE